MTKFITRAVVGLAGSASAAVLITSCATAPEEVVYHPNYPVFANAEGLEESADLVIVGTPISSEVRRVDIAADPSSTGVDPNLDPSSGNVEGEQISSVFTYTVYEVRIDDVVDGDASSGETIEVGFLGGTVDGVTYRDAEGGQELNVGDPVALYLATFEGDVPAQPLNNTQAVYVEEGESFESLAVDNTIADEVTADLTAATQ